MIELIIAGRVQSAFGPGGEPEAVGGVVFITEAIAEGWGHACWRGKGQWWENNQAKVYGTISGLLLGQ